MCMLQLLNHARALGVDVMCRIRNEISQRSSLPDGQLVNEQRVLLINSPRGTALERT